MTQCGHGLFAKHVISPGTYIIQYCGQILTEADFKKLKDTTYVLQVGNQYIDARLRGSMGRFLNHSCKPNTLVRFVHVDGTVQVWFQADPNQRAVVNSPIRSVVNSPTWFKYIRRTLVIGAQGL